MHRDVKVEGNAVPRRRVPSMRYAVLLPAALAAGPLAAQERDTVITRTVSVWQKDVDRLKQELIEQQNLERALYRMLVDVESRKRTNPADSQRAELQAQQQLLFGRMREASLEQGKLKRRIETMCATVRRPEGWLGVVTTGFQRQDTRTDGTTSVLFLEPPMVASVDPGSPAERVGVRSGDVLLELGGRRLLHSNIVFAELLRPGKEITIKLQRGGETVTLRPVVEPSPQVTATPCSWVDPSFEYVLAPSRAQTPRVVRIQGKNPDGSPKSIYGFASARRDSGAVVGLAPSNVSVYAGPMVPMFSGSANSLVGLGLVALTSETSRALGVPHGILVNQVAPGPGRDAGLQGGDVLVSADSVELRSIRQLQTLISRSSDRRVTLVIVRDRKRETVQLRW
jgi:C-terminal processing protease CtpA/Prc